MAHEELKALYEIDKQHSDTPWVFWQHRKLYQVWCDCLPSGPEWDDGSQYRRKPDAPVWPDDKEDARKWRELEEKVNRYGGISADIFNDIRHGKTKLIQDYTAEQWQTIIDGKFLCEFDFVESYDSPNYKIGYLVKPIEGRFYDGLERFPYCRPLHTKGVRQPWFGGECPVDPESEVLARCLDDYSSWYKGAARNVLWDQSLEFIEL